MMKRYRRSRIKESQRFKALHKAQERRELQRDLKGGGIETRLAAHPKLGQPSDDGLRIFLLQAFNANYSNTHAACLGLFRFSQSPDTGAIESP